MGNKRVTSLFKRRFLKLHSWDKQNQIPASSISNIKLSFYIETYTSDLFLPVNIHVLLSLSYTSNAIAMPRDQYFIKITCKIAFCLAKFVTVCVLRHHFARCPTNHDVTKICVHKMASYILPDSE